MDRRENKLRAIRFEKPEYIPMGFWVNPACWHHYPQDALQDLMEGHPLLFPDFKRTDKEITPQYKPYEIANKPYTDPWGCVWKTADDGITGVVVEHPLEDWDALDTLKVPDPEKSTGRVPLDWEKIRHRFQNARKEHRVAEASLEHGHTFMLLSDLRGYENILFDMASEEPKLEKLIELVEEFNMSLIKRYISSGAELMCYPEDLGMQVGPMLSPDHFRQYIKPSYQRLMQPAREKGIIVHMHSDGDIRTLLDDIIDGGVEVINLQDLVNGIDWIQQKLAGKVCIDLDIDRQKITRFGTPEQIDGLIREEIEKLASKEGGLMMIFGLYPGTSLENVKALMDAMEKYAGFYA